MLYDLIPAAVLVLAFALGFILHGTWHDKGQTRAMLTEDC